MIGDELLTPTRKERSMRCSSDLQSDATRSNYAHLKPEEKRKRLKEILTQNANLCSPIHPTLRPPHGISVRQHLLPALLYIQTFSREATPPVLDAHNLIRALFLHGDPQVMSLTPLRLDLQDFTLPATYRIRTACVGELEWRCAPEVEFQISAAALVDVDFADLAARQLDRGDGMDVLLKVESSKALRG